VLKNLRRQKKSVCEEKKKKFKMENKKMDKSSNINSKPVPMKLFAAWEVDRTPSNCIPR
jgi:hypothetical protein